ncbi:hypothetical protein Zmor_013931 [Zophobas morio]|uniref:Uncharacterized protein n=1 Tax=Zophobas morio TaxID=2755281 RepID=A0AA38IJT7_9CUCU|nr:hypothetical protein Zmor_013931 [Zophobas morio]
MCLKSLFELECEKIMIFLKRGNILKTANVEVQLHESLGQTDRSEALLLLLGPELERSEENLLHSVEELLVSEDYFNGPSRKQFVEVTAFLYQRFYNGRSQKRSNYRRKATMDRKSRSKGHRDDAVRAKDLLNNVLVGQRSIMVTWAHSINNEDVEKPRPEINIPALAMSKNEKKADRESQIQAIEAKLKLMEKKAEDELKINDTVATKPSVITQFQYNKQGVTNCNTLKTKTIVKKHDRFNKPYVKHKNSR